MLLFNIIVVLVVLGFQLYNMLTLTTTLRNKTKFMHLNLVNNEYVLRTVKPFKMKLLMYNRLTLLLTIVLSIIVLIFNKSNLVLLAFFLIFGVLLFIFNYYYIAKTTKELIDLEIVEADQDYDIKYFGLFINDPEQDHFYKYPSHRYVINIGTWPGRSLLASAIILVIIFLVFVAIFAHPATKTTEIKSSLSATNLVLSYKDQKTTLPLDKITSIKRENELPDINSRVSGYQENGNNVGVFNLQGIPNATLYTENKTPTYLEIIVNKKYYYFSDDNQANSNTIYDTILKTVENNTKKK